MLNKLDIIAKIIGNTPMLRLERIVPTNGASIYVKLEYMNPGGSHKDRIAWYMLKDAADRGLLKRGGYVIDVSSGNTALSIAWMSARLDLKTIFVVEEEISETKIAALRFLGADVVKVKLEGRPGEDPRFVRAKELERELSGVFLNQFFNEANFRAHYETTAKEIIEQMDGKIDAFVMGIGTGGTIAGVGKRLKEELGGDVKVIGVVPKGSVLLHGRAVGEDRIPGLAKDIMPNLCLKHKRYIDDIVEVSGQEAIHMCKRLAREEGLFVGPSTGAMVTVAEKVARMLGFNGNVVTLAADSIFRYESCM